MKKLLNVDKTFNGMRIDRFLRNHFGQIPQSLIEKNLRNGRIKLNKKKVKSSKKIQFNDEIELHNIQFKKIIKQKKEKFSPSNQITIELNHSDGSSDIIKTNHTYNSQQIDWYREGSALNLIKKGA